MRMKSSLVQDFLIIVMLVEGKRFACMTMSDISVLTILLFRFSDPRLTFRAVA